MKAKTIPQSRLCRDSSLCRGEPDKVVLHDALFWETYKMRPLPFPYFYM